MGRRRNPNLRSSIYKGGDGYWHGRVTLGVRDDGRPDRKHVMGRTRAEIAEKVRNLEQARDRGGVRKARERWRVGDWLTNWIDNIAVPPRVTDNTHDGYRVDVEKHLIPGVGAHWLERLEPEHLERLYARMQDAGLSAGTAHHVHRTIRNALNEAVRRGHLARTDAVAPVVARLGTASSGATRGQPTGQVKSRAGRRTIGLPAPLVVLLRTHRAEQDAEREAARQLWHDEGWVFATQTGGPLNPNTDHHQWKQLLKTAGLREARLHDTRHTAATVLLILDQPERTVMSLMGWSSAGMATRYQHVTDGIRAEVASQVGDLI